MTKLEILLILTAKEFGAFTETAPMPNGIRYRGAYSTRIFEILQSITRKWHTFTDPEDVFLYLKGWREMYEKRDTSALVDCLIAYIDALSAKFESHLKPGVAL